MTWRRLLAVHIIVLLVNLPGYSQSITITRHHLGDIFTTPGERISLITHSSFRFIWGNNWKDNYWGNSLFQ